MINTRFAPSPTGDLHIGGVRTALYSWAYAKKNSGKFILRIEDTDRERSTQDSVQIILQSMQWLGLDYDLGPVFQTDRSERYQQLILQLLTQKQAYYCTCSKQRLDDLRAKQRANQQKPKYDGLCRHQNHPQSADAVVRFTNPVSGKVIFDDLVRGKIAVNNQELDDLIIARADGSPTYNFCVVVDDMDMAITQVIRGDDHINNTPRQINIFKALGAAVPQFAHVPMILGADGGRLSKRHGAMSILAYKQAGYLPEAMLNYLVRLGWSSGEQEIFSLAEIVQLFELKNVNVAASTFNSDKLLWVNQQHIKNAKPEYLAPILQKFLNDFGIDTSNGVDLLAVVKAQQTRAKTMLEMAEISRYFYADFTEYDLKATKKAFKDKDQVIIILQQLLSTYQNLTTWQAEPIHQIIQQITAELATKMGKIAQPLRVAVTGGSASPSIDITLQLIGKAKTLQRLQDAIDFVSQLPNS